MDTSLEVLFLHSALSLEEQKRVFRPPPRNVRRVILSTNIAETSVTLDNITVVIDTGRVREKSHGGFGTINKLRTTWISRASMTQRTGRAGRTSNGFCLRLYSSMTMQGLVFFIYILFIYYLLLCFLLFKKNLYFIFIYIYLFIFF